MADLKASLEISADASGVEAGVNKAKRSLADLGATAATAGKQASDGLANAGAGGDRASKNIDAATKSIIRSIERTTATLDAGGRSTSKYFELLGARRGADVGALKPYIAQLDAVIAKQKLASAGEYVPSAKANAAALRGVPAQLTDIVTSLQGGQRPITVLLQQGGQLKDMFGGIAPAAKALGGAVLGLINPFTIAAAAVAVLGYAFLQGNKESSAYAQALILTGNAAGTTVNELQHMAKAISAVVGTTGAAAEALTAFAATGDIAGASLQRFALLAVRLERATGQTVAETAKQFAALAKDPVAASIKLNETTRFLTITLYQQIKALEDTGRAAEAAALAQRGYADALDPRLGQLENRLGSIERAWIAIKDAAKGAFDKVLDVGRPESDDDRLASAKKDLADRQARGPLNPTTIGAHARGNAAVQATIDQLTERIRLEKQIAEAAAASAAQVKARIGFDKDGEQFISKQLKQEQEIAKARSAGAAAGATRPEIDRRIADIREKFRDKKASPQAGIDKSELNFDIAKLRQDSDQLIGIYKNAEQVLEALRSAGLVSDADYYEAKRAFINLEGEAQEALLRAQIKRFEQEKQLTGKDKIDNSRKIAEAESRLAVVRADSSSKLEILLVQQAAAAQRVALAFLTARQAAQDFFDVQVRQQDRELAGAGQGSEQRKRTAGISQIEDRFGEQKRTLDNQKAALEFEGKFTQEAREQYDNRLKIIAEFQATSIESFGKYYDAIIKRQRSFTLGASEAFADYIAESKKIGDQTQDIFRNTFRGLEDTLTDFITKGKGGFKELGDSIARDIVRATVRQQIGGLFESVGGGLGGKGGFLGDVGKIVGGGIAAGGATTGEQSIQDLFKEPAQASQELAGAAKDASVVIGLLGRAGNLAASALSVLPAIISAVQSSSVGKAIGDAASSFDASSIASFFGGFFADGGTPPMGKVSVVGERGPELFIPRSAGTIVPLDKAPAGGGSSDARPVYVTLNQSFAPGTNRQTIDQAAVRASQAINRSVARGTA